MLLAKDQGFLKQPLQTVNQHLKRIWFAWGKVAEEWRLILANSRPGSKILMRSAAEKLEFLPDSVRPALKFFPELTEPLHRQDRVDTYGSLHLAEVQ